MKKKRKSGVGHSRRDGNGLNRNSVSGVVLGCKSREVEPPPGGVLLDSVPLAPAAHDALSPGQLAARIEVYAYRASLGLPLFDRRSPGETVFGVRSPECWACGASSGTTHPEAVGWSTRKCGGTRFTRMVECYCVGCMDRWGWPEAVPRCGPN